MRFTKWLLIVTAICLVYGGLCTTIWWAWNHDRPMVAMIAGMTMLGIPWSLILASSRKRQSIVDAYIAESVADNARHAAAVEAKLDCIVAILEKGNDPGNSI